MSGSHREGGLLSLAVKEAHVAIPTEDDWGLYTMPAVGGDARKWFRFLSGTKR